MRHLDQFEDLALRSALLSRDEAIVAWTELLNQVSWMDFPDPVERCLPAIAVNLGCHSRPDPNELDEIPSSAKLAGIYRATWTSNIMRIRELSPVFDGFTSHAIQYRVLKGAALCAMADRWGTRRMGDIDVLVPVDQAAASVSVLRELSFSPKYFRVIDDSDPPLDSSWEGPHGHIVDLHVADPERRRPELLDALLADTPSTISSQGRTWPIPSTESLIVHSAMHARKGSAVSDHLQSLIDIAALLPMTNERQLSVLARQTAVTHSLAFLLDEIGRLTATRVPLVKPTRFEPLLVATREFVTRVHTYNQVRRERIISDSPIVSANVRSHLYRIWLRTGQMRPLERVVCRTVGGFLRSGEFDHPRDRRRHIDVLRHLRGRCIRVDIESRDHNERLVFINGTKFGTIATKASIHLNSAPRSLEISLRLLGDPPSQPSAPIRVTVSEETTPWMQR